jgi:hypothetical protein
MNIFEEYASYDISCIPCNDKRPTIMAWKEYQSTIPTPEILRSFKSAQIACICGLVSGGLVCVDFDVKNGDRWDDWCILINNTEPTLFNKLSVETTPSGGYHVVFRTDLKIGNEKLACNKNNEAMIETRGEGGYFVCAPSDNYEWFHNGPKHFQKISNTETELILSAARSFNEIYQQKQEPVSQEQKEGLTPFDDYDSKNTPIDILTSHGWTVSLQRGMTIYLKRPGKKEKGISASWNNVPSRFYCFSTSTVFENNHVYKPSAVFTILEHNGDYSAAAKDLYHKGFGNRKKEKKETQVILIDNKSIYDQIIDIKRHGYLKGKSTGWPFFDKLFSVVKGQFTVITGMPSSGKSEFMDALALNLASKDRWKFVVFSPENYPAKMHYHKLIEKFCGKRLSNIEDDDIKIAVRFINEHFKFIDALEEDIDLSSILLQTKKIKEKENVDCLIIDPWNEIELSKPNDISDSDFIGVCLRKARKFARKENIHLFIIAHPTKMRKDKDGKYPIPELYDIHGSAHWRNKADNGICVHRDYENKKTGVYVQKIKFKYCGEQGEAWFNYERESGRYIETDPPMDKNWG